MGFAASVKPSGFSDFSLGTLATQTYQLGTSRNGRTRNGPRIASALSASPQSRVTPFQQIYGDTGSDKNGSAREYRTQIDVVLIEPNNDVTHDRSLRFATPARRAANSDAHCELGLCAEYSKPMRISIQSLLGHIDQTSDESDGFFQYYLYS